MTEHLTGEDRRRGSLQEPNAYRIEVRDSGPGIPPENLARIFDEFTSESAKTDFSRGGLGLSICRQIVQSHRGQIWAESSETGAKFVFVLPYAPAESGVQAPPGLEFEAMEMGVSA